MLVLNPLTFKEEEVEVGEFEGHEVGYLPRGDYMI